MDYTLRVITLRELLKALRKAKSFTDISEMEESLEYLIKGLPRKPPYYIDDELMFDIPYRPIECPSVEEQEKFAQGELAPRLAEGVYWHMLICPKFCRP